MDAPLAVVTGASSGIGAATARRLVAEGFRVVAVARRADRLAELADAKQMDDATQTAAAKQTNGAMQTNGLQADGLQADGSPDNPGGAVVAVPADITDSADVARLADRIAELPGDLRLLVNNAGGAYGLEPVESADLAAWRAMYEVNVLGTVAVTQALLPRLEASGQGTIVIVSSTAGLGVYEGGGGYTSAKHAETAVAGTLRLELCGRPIRIIEIDPGMVRTEEFSLNRFAGDAARADAVYRGVPEPLVADDIADCIAWCATRPHHVNIDRLVVRPLAQAAQHKVHRVGT